MKKIIISLILIVNCIVPTYIVNANEWDTTTVIVTEKIPGADCVCEDGEWNCDGVSNPRYTCKIGKGFSAVTNIMWAIIKYFTFLAWLFGVLFIVVNGIMYSAGGMDQSVKDEAKKRIIGTLVGLILLFMSGLILNILAPWIYK